MLIRRLQKSNSKARITGATSGIGALKEQIVTPLPITLEELFAWNQETSTFWKGFLEDNPAVLELPCDIGGVSNVQHFVRHIWGVELRWAQRLAGVPEMLRDAVPTGASRRPL